ncbi:MAG TPA: threonine ammonia-lyase IlvA [Acidimicrobiales bacterium]|nr:threonine ammonia-lyase IlvA [Acidimicrobiales bacterium]
MDATAVEAAGDRVRPVVRRTPLEPSDRLSGTVGATVLLKREDMQVGRSYKVRGAYNLISSLTDEERHRGVVCASAGNHGQGLAFCCAALRIHGKVFLPASTPRQKRDRIVAIGGPWVEPVIAGSTFDETNAAAEQDAARRGAVYVHPFDDPRTIAGQGTVAVELAEQMAGRLGPGTVVVVPVGGGGLIAGMAVWLKERHPAARIVGAEPEGAASMTAALAAGGPVDLADIDTFVDGAAVGRVGNLTYPVVRDLVDDMVTVPEGAVCTEMLDLYQADGIIAEPAGALASAAARRYLRDGGGPVVCVVSGGNNDVSRYAEVVERSLLHEGLRHYFLITFPQEPGALRSFLDTVLTHGEDIVVFEYVKKNNRETGPALVGVDLERAEDYKALVQRMEQSPLQIEQVPPGSPLFSFLL